MLEWICLANCSKKKPSVFRYACSLDLKSLKLIWRENGISFAMSRNKTIQYVGLVGPRSIRIESLCHSVSFLFDRFFAQKLDDRSFNIVKFHSLFHSSSRSLTFIRDGSFIQILMMNIVTYILVISGIISSSWII